MELCRALLFNLVRLHGAITFHTRLSSRTAPLTWTCSPLYLHIQWQGNGGANNLPHERTRGASARQLKTYNTH